MEQNTPHHSHNTGHVSGPVTPPYKQGKKKAVLKEVLSTVGILLLAPLTALVLTAFVFQFYRVDGPSMEQTLHHNDRLIVLKLPRSLASITNQHYLPSKGDIIVFNKQEADGTTRQLIKRVIGLPGDRVTVKDNKVIVYDTEHPTGYDPDAGKAHQSYADPTSGNVDLVVPKDEVYVMGDNRPNSLDSRVFGTVRSEDIVGRLVMRVFPFKPVEN